MPQTAIFGPVFATVFSDAPCLGIHVHPSHQFLHEE
jgi:hypothetical protein